MYALQQRSQVHFPVDFWHSYKRVLTAYRLLSYEPTYTTLPSVLRVGEEITEPPVAKDHFLVRPAAVTLRPDVES